MDSMKTEEQLEALGFEPEQASGLATALRLIALIPFEKFEEAKSMISRTEAIGPVLDPTFFIRTPGAFENGRKNRELFGTLVKLKVQLKEGGL